jgi:hypothetical protein
VFTLFSRNLRGEVNNNKKDKIMAVILYLCAVGLYLIYKWATATYDFFEKQGIHFRKPVPFFGTNAGMLFQKQTFIEALTDWYDEFKNEK